MKPMTKFVVVATLFVVFFGLLTWLSPSGRALAFEDKTGSTDVWENSETALPIRVETTHIGEAKVKVVMMNFQYDVDLDPSIFSFEPPPDYTVRKMAMNLTPPSIEDLADMLRFGTENGWCLSRADSRHQG